jgi:hypothetical protein
MVDLLQELGFKVTAPKTIHGVSGMEHTFDMYATKENDQLVLDSVIAPVEVGPEAVAEFFAKILDVKPTRAILIITPNLAPAAQKLSAMYKIDTITGTQIDEITKKLKLSLTSNIAAKMAGPSTHK